MPARGAQAAVTRHPLRNFLMHGFHVLVMLVVGGAIRDTQCGFKVSCFGLDSKATRIARLCHCAGRYVGTLFDSSKS